MKKVLVLVSLLVAIVGCEQSVKDGLIPAKYVAAANQYAGTYTGQFEGQPMNLILSIQNDGRAELRFQDAAGDNALLSECNGQVGKLLSGDVDAKNSRVKTANFSFESRGCEIAGRTVSLSFSKDKKSINVSIVQTQHEEMDETCRTDKDGNDHCTTRWVTVVDSWLTGAFAR